MPVIDRDRWRLLEPLLDEALELSAEQRAPWLEALRTTSPDVAADLSMLLGDDESAERRGFLHPPAVASLAGMVVGAYTLDRPVGHGGMGSVWLARRTDGRFEGAAAVKLLNLALLTGAGQARFRREGSLLARLAHPRIARLLDAGVSITGQPYLVLEYVDGRRIDEFVRGGGLSPAAVVALFQQVLEAVGHAHANLIVHRDLKPSNILVTRDGSVKLLDFGIAKLLDSESQMGDAVTIEGNRLLTPEFAAPEQVRGGTITTATDVYALGVLLYLLLSGRHPTAEGCRTPAEVIRALFDVEPARLGLGDLDSVLATALRRAPAERYQTVAIFAEDLQRWLRNEPVSVRGDSLSYRARKFLRRHARVAVAVAAGALMASAYASTVLIDRAHVRRALAEATTSARKAEQVTDFAVAMFEASGRGPAYADSLSARELLARGVASAHELAGQPEIEAQMLDLIGRIRLEIGDYDGARPVLREALDIRRRTLGENHPDVASSLMNNAALIGASERNRSVAVAMLREASIIRERLFGRSDPRTTDAVYELASALHMSGAYGEARPLFDEWLAAVQRQPMPLTPTRADQLATLGSIMQITGRMDVAERLARQALQLNRALYGPRHARVASSMDDLGGIMLDDERLAGADTLLHGAVAIMRENYPDGHPDLAYMLRDLGYYLMDAHAPLEADTVWRESAALFRRYQGTGSLGYANSMVYVGRVATLRGRYAESEQTLRDVLGMAVTRRGPVNPVGARANVYMGLLLVLEGRSADAEPYLLKGFTMSGNIRAGWQARAVAATELARLYEQQGRRNEAAKYRAVAVVH